MIRQTDKCPLQILLLSIELFLYSIYYVFILRRTKKHLFILIKSDRKHVLGEGIESKGCFYFMTGCWRNFIRILYAIRLYGTGSFISKELRFVIFNANWIRIVSVDVALEKYWSLQENVRRRNSTYTQRKWSAHSPDLSYECPGILFILPSKYISLLCLCLQLLLQAAQID